MSSRPDLTFRATTTPFAALTSIAFSRTFSPGPALPVLGGEVSDNFNFRVYNNFALAAGVATAINALITTFDGSSLGSHTATKSVVGGQWIRVFERGFGESNATPGVFTSYVGLDTPVGGLNSLYAPEKGSDGTINQNRIRAGSNTNGVGFIEVSSYAQVPTGVAAVSYTFSITVLFDWTS